MSIGKVFIPSDITTRLRARKLLLKSGLIFLSITMICRVHSAKATLKQNNCFSCHLGLQNNQVLCAQQWSESVHALFSICCEECHGGDPNSSFKPEIGKEGFIGVPIKTEIPDLCDRCHANPRYMNRYNIRVDEENRYQNSGHGQRLLKEGNRDVADCVDCHGSHDIRITDDPRSRVNHFRIAETCTRCHADNKRMEPYGIPVDQLIQYKKSYHGQILYKKVKGKNPRLAPSCPGCHGIHGGKPAGVTSVANACYNCHLMTRRYFQKSIHSLIPEENQRPGCINCHGYHNIPSADEELFVDRKASPCKDCHSLNSEEYQTGQKLRGLLLQAIEAVDKSQDKINQVKKDLDIDISGFRLKMRDIFDNLDETVNAIHSQDVRTVKPMVQEIIKYTHSLNQQIDGRYREIKRRKKWLAQVLLLISLLFFFTAHQRSKMKK